MSQPPGFAARRVPSLGGQGGQGVMGLDGPQGAREQRGPRKKSFGSQARWHLFWRTFVEQLLYVRQVTANKTLPTFERPPCFQGRQTQMQQTTVL